MSDQSKQPVSTEFVAMMALLISLVALSIDAMLPALPAIGRDLGVDDPNDPQLVLSVLFAGLAIGQLLYGPVSDSTGRKPAIYAGLAIFIAGCLLSIAAQSFEMMLIGRFLQGLGAAGPRVVVVALVRDLYEGRAMARIMSFVMMVFIGVPALAPAIGQAIDQLFGWRAIFVTFLAIALIGSAWFALRQEETQKAGNRQPFSLRSIMTGALETVRIRHALGYTIAAGFVFGGFIGFLVSAQQIFQDTFGVGDRFPVYFATLALSIGSASMVNGYIVMRFGMRLISFRALCALSALSCAFLLFLWLTGGIPPLWAFMAYMMVTFFCFGLLFANFQALAMEPLGHIAGVGAAVVSSLTTFISLIPGTLVGQAFNGTVVPLIASFAGLGILSVLTMIWTERTSAKQQV